MMKWFTALTEAVAPAAEAVAEAVATAEPVAEAVASMYGSNCCFLTCIQISQEPGKVVWYSHLFKNFLLLL